MLQTPPTPANFKGIIDSYLWIGKQKSAMDKKGNLPKLELGTKRTLDGEKSRSYWGKAKVINFSTCKGKNDKVKETHALSKTGEDSVIQ